MATVIPDARKVGMVSLGGPKALVDSERILTRLRADGYAMSADYHDVLKKRRKALARWLVAQVAATADQLTRRLGGLRPS